MLRPSWSPRWVVEIFRQRVDSLFLWVALDKESTQASDSVFFHGSNWSSLRPLLLILNSLGWCRPCDLHSHSHTYMYTHMRTHTPVKWRDLNNFLLYSKVYLTCLQPKEIFIVSSIYTIIIIYSTAIYAEDI